MQSRGTISVYGTFKRRIVLTYKNTFSYSPQYRKGIFINISLLTNFMEVNHEITG